MSVILHPQKNFINMRKILLLVLFAATMTTAKASNTVIVLGLDGKEAAKYDINATQRVDFTNPDSVRIVMTDGTIASFAADEFPKISFTATATGILTPKSATTSGKLRVWADGESLYVGGTTGGESIALFTIGGARIATGKASEGTTRIAIGSLSKGVYVVKAGKQAAKIIKN